jgi:phosphopantothenate synthetase
MEVKLTGIYSDEAIQAMRELVQFDTFMDPEMKEEFSRTIREYDQEKARLFGTGGEQCEDIF